MVYTIHNIYIAVLCVRVLHKAGHECAAGEADPSEVAAKLMAMAAVQQGANKVLVGGQIRL